MTEGLLHELFERQARSTPEVPAVVCEEQSLTFARLNRRANQLARHLRTYGIGPDQLVVLCLERSVDMLVAMLGVLKAGGAYVPLDPGYPPERLAYMLCDASPRVWLTQEKLKDLVPAAANTACVTIDGMWNAIERHSDANLDACATGVTSQHLAYVIYTSGSTGVPKGVMVEHRSVVNLWNALQPVYNQPTVCRRIGVNASLTFDSSVKQLVQVLSGSTLYIIPQSLRGHARALLNYLEQEAIEGIDCTPSQLKKWLAAGLLGKRAGALRTVLVGGEAIDTALWQTLAQCESVAFYNVYGPTECTVDATAARIRNTPSMPHIGRPLQNVEVYLLEGCGENPLPMGEAGEICIGGAGVARGYLNQPQLTAERFISNAFSRDPGARIYRSGDLGRWRADGTLEYLGRRDHQVKVRGHRVELGEIEAQLMRHSHVREAAVVVRQNASGEQRLLAYVALNMPVSVEALRTHLRAVLPEYMVPNSLVELDSLPMTPNGKVDRRALQTSGPLTETCSP